MLADQISTFTTVFLGIFIEAAPFLLLGSVASGLVEVFVDRNDLIRMIPKNRFTATVMGGVMGFAFPVCECGVVPLTRRLFRKGLPVSAGIAFLLAAPILNPVVLASTFAAYGFGTILIMRFVMGLIVAMGVGLVFSFNASPTKMMHVRTLQPVMGGAHDLPNPPLPKQGFKERFEASMRVASDEFFDMGRYLILGSMLAALMQTLVPQSTLLALGSGPVSSVLLMQALGFVLSVCSTVDAFLSLAFAGTFTTGSILAFLVFGPMVDIKSTLMYLGVFRAKIVVYLVTLPFLLTLLLSVFINLNLNW